MICFILPGASHIINIALITGEMFVSSHNLLHHLWLPQTCISSNICTLFLPLKESLHKISLCHLYKHSTEDGRDGSHQKTVQLDDKFVSGMPVIIFPGILQGILVHHFENGYPLKTIKKD